jgi:hypothetical protein
MKSHTWVRGAARIARQPSNALGARARYRRAGVYTVLGLVFVEQAKDNWLSLSVRYSKVYQQRLEKKR